MRPWVELVEVALGGKVGLELRVSAFSSAHRLANTETPKRVWFEVIGGNCIDGRGVAFCYREGLVFDGPFMDGLPEGTGEQVFADGTAYAGALYQAGKLMLMGSLRPEAPDYSDGVTGARADWVANTEFDRSPSDFMDDWAGIFDFVEIPPAPEPEVEQVKDYRRTCDNCYGSGTVWTRREVEVYDDTMVLSGTSLWRRGFTHIRETSTQWMDVLAECYSCFGRGYRVM